MPQYISDNTDDEISHAAFLKAYLASKGEQVDPFRVLPPTKATGAHRDLKRLTNFQTLNVDTSRYFRYRRVNRLMVAFLRSVDGKSRAK